MSQQCGIKPSHGPLQGPMLVSHYELLNISLAEMQHVNQQSAQLDRAHETISLTSWQAKTAAAGNLPSRKISQHGHKNHQNASIRKLGMTHSGNSTH